MSVYISMITATGGAAAEAAAEAAAAAAVAPCPRRCIWESGRRFPDQLDLDRREVFDLHGRRKLRQTWQRETVRKSTRVYVEQSLKSRQSWHFFNSTDSDG